MLTFQNIVYVYCDKVDNQVSLAKAVTFAEKNEAKLTVIFTFTDKTIPDSLGLSTDDISQFINEKEQQQDDILAQYADRITISKDIIFNDKYLDVVRKVDENDFDLLIKPSESEGLLSKLFGSNDMSYLRNCPCPVWLVSGEEAKESHIIVAAVDVTEGYPNEEQSTRDSLNVDILKTAYTLALLKNAQLKIVSIWSAKHESILKNSIFSHKSKEEAQGYLSIEKQRATENLNTLKQRVTEDFATQDVELLTPELVTIKGKAREELPNYANSIDADLVVMGTVARVGIPGFIIGNTAESILYRLNQSVFAIKPQGYVSPVLK